MGKWIYIVLTVVVCVTSVCGSFAVGHAEDDRIIIAFVGDFSGPSRGQCNDAYDAALMAVQEINDKGGLLGRAVEIIKLDGGNDPQRHYRTITELGSRKEVAAIMAGATSSVLLEGSRASLEQKIPYLISVGNSHSVTVDNGHPYVFLFQASSYMQIKAFSIFATLMPWRKYGWIGPDNVWGREMFHYFQQHFIALGTPIEWKVQVWHSLGNQDFKPMIREILEAEPEALFLASWGGDFHRFIDQARLYDIAERMAIFGLDAQVASFEGMWGLSPAPVRYLADKHPLAQVFVDRFQERYHKYPSSFTINSYDAVQAWMGAVLKANSFHREAVAEALKGLVFQGLRGEGYIRPIDGQMNCPTYFGRSSYQPDQKINALDQIVEIPAAKTWSSEQEIMEVRKKATSP